MAEQPINTVRAMKVTLLDAQGKPVPELEPLPDPKLLRLDLSYWCPRHVALVTLGMAQGTLSGPKATVALLQEFARLPWVLAHARREADSDESKSRDLRPFIVALAVRCRPLCCQIDPSWLQRALDAGRKEPKP